MDLSIINPLIFISIGFLIGLFLGYWFGEDEGFYKGYYDAVLGDDDD